MDWHAARAGLAQHRDGLLRKAHVVGCGIGWKQKGGRPTLVPAICVFVSTKVPLTSLRERDQVPLMLDGAVTDVIETGKLHMLSFWPPSPLLGFQASEPERQAGSNGPTRSDEESVLRQRTSRLRPAQPGVSVASFRVSAGTLGAIVRDRGGGRLMVLSNNHVLANSSNGRDGRAAIGDPIVQPGPFDGGRVSDDTIAHLTRFQPLSAARDNDVDAAVGAVTSAHIVTPAILGLGRLRGMRSARMGLSVRMSGRTSGVVNGHVVAIDVTANVGLPTGETARFVNQIATTPMAQPGDSGSLLVDTSLRAVGLIFAGSASLSLANTIQRVLTRLGVSLV